MSKLRRELTLSGLTLIAIGSCIGSGIFLTPSQVAQHLGSPVLILGVWALGGCVALTGALTFAELGAMFPRAGGVYVYLREGYGDLAAFWYGWAYFVVVNSGALAALTLACAYYVGFLVPLSGDGQLAVACGAVVVVTTINVLRVKLVQLFAGLFTGLKLAGIAAIVGVGLWMGSGGLGTPAAPAVDGSRDTLSALGLALVGVFFSYGGWHHASYLSGEARDSSRTIPRAMILGALIVTLTYLAINIAFMRLLGVEKMAASQKVAADAISTVMPSGASAIAVIIVISTFGTALIYTLSAPRIYFAMAEDGLFFRVLARVHPTFHTPVAAVLFQSAWAIVLILAWGTFEEVITYVTFTDWIFFTLAASLVFVFRVRRPDAERSYRTLGYPVTPLIFICVSVFFIVNTLIERPVQAVWALGLLGSGLPFYLYFKRAARSSG
ncbi:MAG: amino acid permease [Planctomycetes bacterium]|nr:amino acid permease [Planctomycetota bacterium]